MKYTLRKKILLVCLIFTTFIGAYNAYTVVSNHAAERVEHALIAADGSCTITSQSGTWIASTTHNSVGDCTLTLTSGIFSARPHCFFTVENTNASINAGMVKLSTTSAPSSTLIRFTTTNSGGTLTDYITNVFCMGPR